MKDFVSKGKEMKHFTKELSNMCDAMMDEKLKIS